ncbi:hypothetical protein EVAR_89799_1 [Eumeta japonica]|uniref:Uncharacterized protein n=1 Tax=Eumeta variegata TaxID=151549 RepID=A0A4C2A2N9_EUMVA|nr:hypothetical protein EVAR_89799_1 [Eumeta japonica]
MHLLQKLAFKTTKSSVNNVSQHEHARSVRSMKLEAFIISNSPSRSRLRNESAGRYSGPNGTDKPRRPRGHHASAPTIRDMGVLKLMAEGYSECSNNSQPSCVRSLDNVPPSYEGLGGIARPVLRLDPQDWMENKPGGCVESVT